MKLNDTLTSKPKSEIQVGEILSACGRAGRNSQASHRIGFKGWLFPSGAGAFSTCQRRSRRFGQDAVNDSCTVYGSRCGVIKCRCYATSFAPVSFIHRHYFIIRLYSPIIFECQRSSPMRSRVLNALRRTPQCD